MDVVEGETIYGPAGTATQVVAVGEPDRPDWKACVGTWFLHCPGQSPAWDRYLLTIIHLRDIEGVPPAEIRVPRATHEVMLVALDPTVKPVAGDVATWRHLRPVNVYEQVELPGDAAATEMLELCVRAVVNGVLPAEPPLAGAREPWRTTLIKTAAHLRGEEHAP